MGVQALDQVLRVAQAPVVAMQLPLQAREVVRGERMQENLDSSHGLYFSQRLLLALVESGLSRDDAYRLVQRHAMQAWDDGVDFRSLVVADPEIVERVDLAAVFAPGAFTAHVDVVFDRLHALVATRSEGGGV